MHSMSLFAHIFDFTKKGLFYKPPCAVWMDYACRRMLDLMCYITHQWHDIPVSACSGSPPQCSTFSSIINPRCACAARVTVLGLCVCVCVCVCVSVTQHLTLNALIRATNDSNFPSGRWRSKILSDFFWKCFVAKLERFLLVRLQW